MATASDIGAEFATEWSEAVAAEADRRDTTQDHVDKGLRQDFAGSA